ncbi:hypothetical protein E2320_008070, partial [Naja naja]
MSDSESEEESANRQLKFVLLGDGACGKVSPESGEAAGPQDVIEGFPNKAGLSSRGWCKSGAGSPRTLPRRSPVSPIARRPRVPLSTGKAGMHAKCNQCNAMVARMKQQHEKCCDERTMFEETGPSGETTINIKDSGNYPLSKLSSSRSIVSELSLQDSASVISFTHIHNILPERKKPSGTSTTDKFVIKPSRLEK